MLDQGLPPATRQKKTQAASARPARTPVGKSRSSHLDLGARRASVDYDQAFWHGRGAGAICTPGGVGRCLRGRFV